MSVVHRGVPDGQVIMQKFGGDAKKKTFLYWKRGETRRYLTAIAQRSNIEGLAQLSICSDDDADNELLQSPFDDIIVVDPSPQVTRQRRRLNPATRTSTTTRTVNTVTQSTGFYGTPFYRDGTRAGTVEQDLLPNGLDGTSSFDSRTSEVSRCESILVASSTDDDTSLVPFLNHTFEEVCWQACEDKRGIVVVLLDPTSQSQLRESMLRFLRRVNSDCGNSEWFYWAAETSSSNGQKVLMLYDCGEEDQIIFLAPATQNNPIFIERIEVTELQDFDLSTLYERVRAMIQGLTLERDQLELTRQLRQDQENDLNEALQRDNNTNIHIYHHEELGEENEADMIREQRKKRFQNEPAFGVKIVICLSNGVKIGRCFDKGALFQEVYDWAGTLQDVPLYFTLHIGGKIVHHEDKVEGSSVLHLTERGKEEAASLLASEVREVCYLKKEKYGLASEPLSGS